MTTMPFPGTDEFNQVWTRAYFHADDAVGTQHLLFGMLHIPRISRLLDACDVTLVVLNELVKRSEPESGVVERMLSVTVTPVEFSSAAAAALDRCQAEPSAIEPDPTEPDPAELDSAELDSAELDPAERGPADVLVAILEDPRNRASEILVKCGVNLGQLRAALTEDRLPQAADPVPADLRPARDALLGRTRYRMPGGRVRNWLRNKMIGVSSLNYAAHPALWVLLEAGELARRNGHRTRSDDVLLALITTHEVALAYSHLVRSPSEYSGGKALLAAGLDHDLIGAARAAEDLGEDAVPLPERFRDWPQDTGQILRQLLCGEGTRSFRLLATLGVRPSALVVLGPKIL